MARTNQLENDYRRLVSGQRSEGDYIEFFGRAEAGGNQLLIGQIISDAAFDWGMFRDETEEFLRKQISF